MIFYLSKGVYKVRVFVDIAISIKNGGVPPTRVMGGFGTLKNNKQLERRRLMGRNSKQAGFKVGCGNSCWDSPRTEKASDLVVASCTKNLRRHKHEIPPRYSNNHRLFTSPCPRVGALCAGVQIKIREIVEATIAQGLVSSLFGATNTLDGRTTLALYADLSQSPDQRMSCSWWNQGGCCSWICKGGPLHRCLHRDITSLQSVILGDYGRGS